MREEEKQKPSTVKMIRAGDKALWFGRGMTGYGEWHLGIFMDTDKMHLHYIQI